MMSLPKKIQKTFQFITSQWRTYEHRQNNIADSIHNVILSVKDFLVSYFLFIGFLRVHCTIDSYFC